MQAHCDTVQTAAWLTLPQYSVNKSAASFHNALAHNQLTDGRSYLQHSTTAGQRTAYAKVLSKYHNAHDSDGSVLCTAVPCEYNRAILIMAWRCMEAPKGLLRLHQALRVQCFRHARIHFDVICTWYLMTEQPPRAHGTASAEDRLYVSQVVLFKLSAAYQSCLPPICSSEPFPGCRAARSATRGLRCAPLAN